MLVNHYVIALLVGPDAADMVWEAWPCGLISDVLAALAWSILAASEPS